MWYNKSAMSRSPLLRLVTTIATILALVGGMVAPRLLAAPPAATPPSQEHSYSAGPIAFKFTISYPSNLFNVVDQISLWSPYCHRQYRDAWEARWPMSAEDKSLLARYAQVRTRYDYGIMEPWFMNASSLDDAWTRARAGGLTIQEATTVKTVLSRFQPKFDQWWNEAGYLEQRRDDLIFAVTTNQQFFKLLYDRVLRLYGYNPNTYAGAVMEVHLLYAPWEHGSGGGAHSGIELELGAHTSIGYDEIGTLIHESLHLLVEPRKADIMTYLKKLGVPEEAWDILHESLVYTIAQGVAIEYMSGRNSLATRLQGLTNPEGTMHRTIQIALDLEPITKEYLESGKTLWDGYLDQVANDYLRVVGRR